MPVLVAGIALLGAACGPMPRDSTPTPGASPSPVAMSTPPATPPHDVARVAVEPKPPPDTPAPADAAPPASDPPRADDVAPPPGYPLGTSLGMRCSYSSRFLRERYGLGPGRGCHILRVTSGGAADRAGVRVGDRLVSVDGVPVTSGRQFVMEILEFGEGPHQAWTLERGSGRFTVDVWWAVPGARPLDDPYADYLAGRDNGGYAADVAHFTDAIARDPNFDLAHLYRGQERYDYALREGGDPTDAQVDVLRALELDPDLPEARESLARMLANGGSPEQAMQQIDAALAYSACPATLEFWDYDCAALLLTRSQAWLMQPVPDDVRAEADVVATRAVRSADDAREEMANRIAQFRLDNALFSGTCQRAGVREPCGPTPDP